MVKAKLVGTWSMVKIDNLTQVGHFLKGAYLCQVGRFGSRALGLRPGLGQK